MMQQPKNVEALNKSDRSFFPESFAYVRGNELNLFIEARPADQGLRDNIPELTVGS